MVFHTTNPTTGKVLQTYPEITDTSLFQALETAEAQFQEWRFRPIPERSAIVGKAASILRSKSEEYAGYITLEMGKLIDQSRWEVATSADILDYYASHAETLLKEEPLAEVPGSVVVSEPIGVILAIEPWNFPYYQLARIAGPQIVAGNVVLVKHAQNVPQCALAFARLFEEAGAPEGVYTNLFCSIEQSGLLIDDFRVRGVTLTGSERAGASVGARAGRNLKKVVLELGGSDPFIVLEDAPLESTLDMAVPARLMCMGQACTSSKRFIIVGKERGQKFLDGLVVRFGAANVGDPTESSTGVGPVVSEQALKGLLAQIEEAKAAGARIVLGGNQISRAGFYLEPTIITDISEDNPLFQQEAFGPVASVYIVEDEESAIRVANATKFGLGSSVISADVDRAKKIASKIESGMVCINSPGWTAPELPFGGVKNSGFGRELGTAGIGEFLNKKLVRVA